MKWFRIVAFNLILFVIFFEGLGVFFIDRFEDKLEKIRQSESYKYMEHVESEKPKLSHPFFGYLPPKEKSFENPENFSSRPRDISINIGIFGGSTAEGLHDYWQKNLAEYTEKFSRALNVPSSKIRLVNFAAGGYKQPTQLNIASLYAHNLSYAINLDGYNEMTYAHDGRFPPYYPLHVMTQNYYSQPKSFRFFSDAYAHYEQSREAQKSLQSMSWSNALKLAMVLKVLWHKSQMERANHKAQELHRPFVSSNYKETFWSRARFWLKSSCLQQNLHTQLGVRSMFVQQPVPYLSNRKPLSAEERQWVESSRDARAFASEYNRISSKIEALQPQKYGITYIDATYVYRNVKDTVYIDGCCHLNDLGNKILSSKILEQLELDRNQSEALQWCRTQDLMSDLEL